MVFNSLTFFYFLAVLMIGHSLLPLKLRNIWILALSIVFYMSWSPIFILLLLVTAAVDFTLAIKMSEKTSKKEKTPYLIASLVFSLGSLFFFKYSNMFIESAQWIASIWGYQLNIGTHNIELPLGISFYTFETVSYAVDVYRGELKPKKSFFEYVSFLMFFPKLIAGPIVRAKELLYQIPLPRICTEERFQQGLNLLMIGFGKKVLLADNFAPFIESVFANPLASNRWMAIVAIYGYSMQVYLDFSAYTDIARGCAKWLGYELPINFNKPYLATSITDFWRRWHMTLSRWMRDYLYIPLGGNSGTKLTTYRNLYLTMLIGGLWHGANWTFVVWGALNGAFLVLEKAWYDLRGLKPKKESDMSTAEKMLRITIVFNLITFTRIFFRSPDFKTALQMLEAVIKPQTFTATIDLSFYLIPASIIGYFLISPYRQRLENIRPLGAALYAYGAAIALCIYFGASNAEFIYFQF
jgi:D-alanyl-lipoteichoic acid acyltransferase DltB (MBOAT superfamily)